MVLKWYMMAKRWGENKTFQVALNMLKTTVLSKRPRGLDDLLMVTCQIATKLGLCITGM